MIFKFKSFILCMFLCMFSLPLNATTPLSDELIQLHKVNTSEMNAIASPSVGSLIFNIDDNEVYGHNTTGWNRISSDGSETKMIAGNCIGVDGIGTASSPYTISLLDSKTQETARTTCKTILDAECHSGDGIYWINPDGGDTSNAFEVYCDMTTDGGGWTRLEYAADLTHKKQFNVSSDGNRWLANNFSLTLTDTQINDIRAASTEGKQRYHGTCQGVIHHYYTRGNSYNYAFGFRYHQGHETAHNQQTYPSTNIAVSNDTCQANDGVFRSTDFDIIDIRVPIVNVHSRDNGNNEKFGSPLTNYPAWFR